MIFPATTGTLDGMTSDMTTVKVNKSVRERITRAARTQHVPANDFLNRLVTDWERQQRIAGVAAAMAAANDQTRAEYADESAQWDVTLADGLGEK